MAIVAASRGDVMSTLEKVRKVIASITHCNEQEVNQETALKDIKADSLHWVQIIVGLENDLDIEIDFEEMKKLSNIDDFINYIDSCIK